MYHLLAIRLQVIASSTDKRVHISYYGTTNDLQENFCLSKINCAQILCYLCMSLASDRMLIQETVPLEYPYLDIKVSALLYLLLKQWNRYVWIKVSL